MATQDPDPGPDPVAEEGPPGKNWLAPRETTVDGDGHVAFESAKTQLGLGFSPARAGTLVLANTLLGGSGMLGLPHAFVGAGWVLGVILLCVFGTASGFGCHLLHCSARRIGHAPSSFYTVANATVPRWTWLIDGAVAVKCFGVGTSYLIIVGDLLPPVVKKYIWADVARWHCVLFGFFIAGPLACLKNLTALQYTAIVAVAITMWTATLIILFYLRAGAAFEPCQGSTLPCNDAMLPAFPETVLSFGKRLSVFIFAFTCQQNIFTISNETRNASKRRIDNVVRGAYSVSGTIFGVAAIFGAMTYGDKIESNVLTGYPLTTPVYITYAAYSLLAVLSYPMQAHPSRCSILALVNLVKPLPPRDGSEIPLQGGGLSAAENFRFWVVSACFLTLSIIVALTVDDLGIVLEVVGATGSTMVSYILPGLVYVNMFPKPHFKRTLAWGQLIAGCIIMPSCLIMIFVPEP